MSKNEGIIDLYSVETFDDESGGELKAHRDVIHGHMRKSRREWLESEASDRMKLYSEIPFAEEFILVKVC